MKYSRNRIKFTIVLCLSFWPGFFLLTPEKNTNELTISSYYEKWWQRLNIHSSPKIRLTFRDLGFYNIIGSKPFYINLPSINAIMFVQDNHKSGQRIVILYNDVNSVIFEDPYTKFTKKIGDSNFEVVSSEKVIELKCYSDQTYFTYWFDIPTRKWDLNRVRE